jgi:hypothetical protein
MKKCIVIIIGVLFMSTTSRADDLSEVFDSYLKAKCPSWTYDEKGVEKAKQIQEKEMRFWSSQISRYCPVIVQKTLEESGYYEKESEVPPISKADYTESLEDRSQRYGKKVRKVSGVVMIVSALAEVPFIIFTAKQSSDFDRLETSVENPYKVPVALLTAESAAVFLVGVALAASGSNSGPRQAYSSYGDPLSLKSSSPKVHVGLTSLRVSF